jgi:hypothetical protein
MMTADLTGSVGSRHRGDGARRAERRYFNPDSDHATDLANPTPTASCRVAVGMAGPTAPALQTKSAIDESSPSAGAADPS